MYMRTVVQRVKESKVEVKGETVGAIGPGLLIFLGVGKDDSEKDCDYLANKIYGSSYTGISIGHSFDSLEAAAADIKDKTLDSGYNSICFTGTEVAGCTGKVIKPDYSNYQHRRFAVFGDHGTGAGWGSTLYWNQIPWLDLSYALGDACGTGEFWAFRSFSANWLRKGGISYQGAVCTTFLISPSQMYGIKYLTSDDASTISLGRAHKLLCSDNKFTRQHFILFGDPALQLKLKQVTW